MKKFFFPSIFFILSFALANAQKINKLIQPQPTSFFNSQLYKNDYIQKIKIPYVNINLTNFDIDIIRGKREAFIDQAVERISSNEEKTLVIDASINPNDALQTLIDPNNLVILNGKHYIISKEKANFLIEVDINGTIPSIQKGLIEYLNSYSLGCYETQSFAQTHLIPDRIKVDITNEKAYCITAFKHTSTGEIKLNSSINSCTVKICNRLKQNEFIN